MLQLQNYFAHQRIISWAYQVKGLERKKIMTKKIKKFNHNYFLIETPMLSDDNYSSIASVGVYFNEYGAVIVSASNHDGATGYYSLPLDYILERLEDEALKYIYECMNCELKKRGEK